MGSRLLEEGGGEVLFLSYHMDSIFATCQHISLSKENKIIIIFNDSFRSKSEL